MTILRSARSPAFVENSALQRAENSSMTLRTARDLDERAEQCSSASRKFLNDQFRLVEEH